MNKAVIFDFDGVIADSHGIFNALFTKIANDNLNIGITEEDFARYPGMRFEERLVLFAKQKKIPLNLKDIIRTTEIGRLEYYSNSSSYVKIFPGIKELLEILKKNNIKAGIGTNGSRKNAINILERNNILDYFGCIVGFDEVKHAKPNPEMFLKNAKAFNARPEKCIVIDDAIEGILAGRAAGMKVIGVATTTDKKDLEKADIVVDSIKEIDLEMLNRLFGK